MIKLSNFAECLLEVMSDANLNAPVLAKLIGTDRSNITRYLRAERAPSFNTFVKLLEFFNCSADYMLGLSDFSIEKEFLPVSKFDVRLIYVMKFTNTTQYGIEKKLHISGDSIYKWTHGKGLPSVDNLVKLANFMGVSVDFLLGRVN